MVSQLSLIKTFLLAAWTEVIFWFYVGARSILTGIRDAHRQSYMVCMLHYTSVYIDLILYLPGFLCCIFGATMYVYLSPEYGGRYGPKRDRHTTVRNSKF